MRDGSTFEPQGDATTACQALVVHLKIRYCRDRGLNGLKMACRGISNSRAIVGMRDVITVENFLKKVLDILLNAW